jgi:hypothetical protein
MACLRRCGPKPSARCARLHCVQKKGRKPIRAQEKGKHTQHASRSELRLHGSRQEDGRFPTLHAEQLLAVLDHVELEGDDSGNLNGAAERDLAVALGKV